MRTTTYKAKKEVQRQNRSTARIFGGFPDMRLKNLFSLTLVLMLLCVGKAYSQFDTSSITGRIADASGAVVPGATVTATNVDTNVSITRVTNRAGEYNIPALKEGTYRVTVKMPGFNDYIKDEIHLDVGTNQKVDVALSVGTSEQVVVNENALELEADTSQKQQVITGEQVDSFPLQSMDYTDMLKLASGVTQDAAGEDLGTSSVTREGSYNINGMRSTYNNYLLDGIDNNAHGTSNQGFSNQVIQTNAYSIAQFSIVTTLPPAEFGRSAAGTINTVTKGGTNKLHALLFEAFQNTAMDANGFFVAYDAVGNPRKTTLQGNRFGGNVGGPIFRGKFFYFVDYEGWRRVRDIVNVQNTPSVNYHQLIMAVGSATPTLNQYNPYTGERYPNTRPLPRNVLDPIALAILDAMPMPNNNGALSTSVSANYSVLQRFTNSLDKGDVRLDAQINDRTSVFARVSHFKEHDLDGPTLPEPLSGGNGYFRTINQQVAIGVTRQIRATQLLEARIGASYTKGGKMPIVLGDPRTFGVKGLPTDPRVWGGLTSISTTAFSSPGRQSTNPQWQYPFYLNPKVTYSYLVGHHNFKAGYEFGYMRQSVQDVNPIYGVMQFDASYVEEAMGDFLFGYPDEIDMTNFYVAHIRQGGHSAFFQDDWKVTPKLTLNLGVRYEYASHFYDKDDHLTNYDPIQTPISGQLIRAKSGGSVYQKQLINPDLNDVMPRFGFAYAPNRSIVIHGGYGIGYMHYTRSGESDNLAINGPQVNAAVYIQVPHFCYTPATNCPQASITQARLQDGYPAGMSDPANFNLATSSVKYIPKNYVDPYVQSWYVGFQSRLSKTALFDVAFVGNHAIKMQEVGDYNQRRPELGVDPVTGYFQRPNPAIGDVLETFNGGYSNYSGLQARFQEQGFHGLWILNAFTWSRDFGNVTDPLTASHGFSGSPLDFFHLTGDYGPTQYDLPIINNTALTWTLPVGRGKLLFRHAGKALNQGIGGWQVSMYNTYHSGPTLTPSWSVTGVKLLSNQGGVASRPFLADGVTAQQAKQRLHVPHHPEEAFCDSVYDSPGQAVYNGCQLMFATTNPHAVANPSTNTADWSGTVNDPRGNVSVGFLRGDWLDSLDASVNKKFSLPWHSSYFEFRLQFYNVLNKTNFTTPGMTCCSTSFGRISSTYGPGRIGQIQGRIWF